MMRNELANLRSNKRHRYNIPLILLVDDDPEITQMIAIRLAKYEVDVVRRCTGWQGISEANRAKPDLIITDVRMSQGDGEDLLSCIKQNQATTHIPVIVLSGQRGGDTSARMTEMGAAAFLQKPMDGRLLIDEICKHVEMRELVCNETECV